MAVRINAAVEANLRKVLAEEQQASALRMAWVRLCIASVASVLIWLPQEQMARETLRPTRYGVLAFVLASALILVLTQRIKRLGRWAALSVPLVDVPFIVLIQTAQQPLLPQPWMSIPSNVSVLCALTTLSILSLSRPIIVLTALMSIGGMSLVTGRSGMPFRPLLLTGLMMLGIAVAGIALVARLRRLLHQARAKDLVGKYILGERLGSGGMAEVFLAMYSPEGGFERKVAVKRILPSYADNPESVALFRREAELGALLNHPNVVQVLDFGTDGTGYFLAMEYVDGLSLARILAHCRRARETVPLPVFAYVACMLAEALDYMHTRASPTGTLLKLVHRDVNPPNILVSRGGDVKLGDFGIARAAIHERLTVAGNLRGKIGYSAPEHLRDEPYDSRADLFSLGVSLHELLLSRRLFNGNSEVTLFRACLEGPIPLPSQGRQDVPPELEALVMGLLERDVALRTQSAREVVERLRTLPPSIYDLVLGKRQLAELVARTLVAAPTGVPAQEADTGVDIDAIARTVDILSGDRSRRL